MARGELDRLRALYRVSRTFHASLDLAELLPRVLLETVEALEAEVGSLWLLEGDERGLVCHIATGPAAGRLQGVEIPLGAGIVGAVAATRRPEIVTNAAMDRRFLFQIDQQTGFTTHSMVCAPLLAAGKCLGVLQILNCRSPDTFFERGDMELLEAIAADAAQALENARLFAAAQRAEDLATLLRLSRELTATLNPQLLLEHLVQAAAALTGCERAAVALLPSSGNPLRVAASTGVPDMGLADRVRAAARFEEERYVPDLAAAEEPPFAAGAKCRSLLTLPLRDADGVVGILYLEAVRTEAFTLRQRELATILAQQATVAVRNALLYNQVPLFKLGGLLQAVWKPGAVFHPQRPWRRWGIMLALGTVVALMPWDYRVVGRFQLRPAARVEVTAQTTGTVQRVHVREGQAVRPGEVLAVLADRDVEREWAETEARRDLARQGLQHAQAAGDVAEYRQQLTAVRREEALLALLARRRAEAHLRSPLAGVVLTPRLEERVGEVLARGAPFCLVGASNPLEAEVLVSEDRAGAVAPGQTVFLKLTALPGRRFRARVTRVGAVARPDGGGASLPVVCAVANPSGRFRPGQGGWAKISLGRRPLAHVLLIRAWDTTRLWWWRLW